MKEIGVREFRDRASHYLSSEEPIAIKRRGETIGYYFPRTPRQKVKEALDRLERIERKIMKETGITEDELSQAMNWKAPFPDLSHLPRRRKKAAAKRHAPGR